MGFQCLNLGKEFHNGKRVTRVLDDVSFSIEGREFVAIVGPSGCGKTTLLKLIAGLTEPTRGQIRYEQSSNPRRLRSALVFQEHGIFPWMTVRDNVAFGLRAQKVPRRASRESAMALVARFGLADFADYYPDQLSVGMQQRVGLARAFLADPEYLLMDEPFASLDAQTKLVLQDELLQVWRTEQKLVVYVTHDIDEAIRLSDRILVLTGRPARVREEVVIPLRRPRRAADTDSPGIADIKWHIWSLIEKEVRANARMATVGSRGTGADW